jgi:hypothetical protein
MAISNLRPASAFEVAWRGVSTDDLAAETAARIADVNAEEAARIAADAALAADIADMAAADDLARAELLTEPGVSEMASLWSPSLTGEPKNRGEIAASDVVFDGADGLVIRVTGAAIRAPRISYRMVPGHKYEVLAMARRETDPHDAAGNSVSLRATWLNASKAAISSSTLESFALLGSSLHLYRKVVSTVAGSEVDTVAVANTVYFTPFIQTFGTDGATNILPYIRVTDLTSNTLISADVSGLDARLDALESANLDTRLSAVEALVAGSAIARFKTRAAASAATIPVSVDMLETLSYATDGDGGGARYKRIAGPSTSLGDFSSAGGAWWQHVPSYGPLRLAEYGVAAAASVSGAGVWSGTDVEPKIKAGLYSHVYQAKGTAAELPIGNLFLGRGIHLGYGTTFQGGRIRGSGVGINYQAYPMTSLVWNFTDEPALSIQGGRSMQVEDIAFSGPGIDYLSDNNIGLNTYAGAADDTLLATWVDPSWPAQASSRYAPAAAIAIDPRTAPADATSHYRDVAYPAEMGAVSQYSKNPSSGFTLENFDFYGGGMVAVVVHPNNNSDGNGDFVRLKSGRLFGVPIGLSVGQTQARLTSCDGVDFAVNHTAITTNMHGKQNGVFTEAWNCHFSGIQIFNFQDTSIAGHITINGYGEELWRIGDVAASTAVSLKLILHNLKLSFENQTTNRGVPATMLGGGGFMPIEINGGAWTNFYGVAFIDHPVNGVAIRGLVVNPRDPTSLSAKCAHNGLAGGLVFPALGSGYTMDEINPKFVPWNLDTGAGDFGRILGKRWRSSRPICTPIWAERHCSLAGENEEGVFVGSRVSSIDIATSWGSASLSGLTLSMTWLGGWTEEQFMRLGPLPGDVMLHDASKSVFVCLTRAGTSVTFQLVNNFRGTTPRSTINLTSGQAWLACTRWYSPSTAIYGTITAGSSVISDAGFAPAGGGGQYGGFMLPDIAVNDYLIADRTLAPYLNQALCKVTAVDETAMTITLSGNAIATSPARMRLGTFVRPGVS